MYETRDFSNIRQKCGLSDKALDIHFKLYEGYVKNTNLSLEKLKNLDKTSSEYSEIKRRLGWEWNGMRLHEYFFESLGEEQEIEPGSKIHKFLEENFGSFEAWQEDFVSCAKMRGIGWVALYQDHQGKLNNFWISEHDGGHPAGAKILLILDVFEHAFFPDFFGDKGAYIESLLKHIDWKVVEKRLAVG